MGKSRHLRLRELRDAYRLIGECRDLGDDVGAWRQHALLGLRRLLDAQVAVGLELRDGGPGRRKELIGLVDLGWASPAAQRHFRRYVEEGGMERDPTLLECVRLARPLVTRKREQVIEDRQWYASFEFNEYRRPAESDDWIGSVATLSGPPAFHVLSLDRVPGAARFTSRERRLVHVFHHELARLVGPVLSRDPGGIEAALPPRLRQTLACLLEGDGEKQVAVRLGLSPHTVHEYVTALYRRFDVSSRSELLARFLGRRGPLPEP